MSFHPSAHRTIPAVLCLLVLAAVLIPNTLYAPVAPWRLLGWNDLGMHCMDGDYSLFAILPPYNTIHAQLLDSTGALVAPPPGVTVTYEAVTDAAGSINRSSIGKTLFWDHVGDLFGATPAPDHGLAGWAMPGAANVPQAMAWDGASGWFEAEGIPITPWDDAATMNAYPLMRLVARDGGGQLLAETRIVVPVSEEMECTACHASGSAAATEPGAGWAWDPNPQRDFRINILRLHDDLHLDETVYKNALQDAGYSKDGLWPTADADGVSVLCARCHASNALGTTGVTGVAPLTRAMHAGHADAVDPQNGLVLDSSLHRSACYQCHPGRETRCLRDPMGRAVAADGAVAMQCQSCHGTMSRVGDEARAGWFEEPTCQSCHTGTATANNGEIRYTSVFTNFGAEREAVDDTFATNPDAPAPGLDLYRFSRGHGGLYCSACHGSPHAVFATLEPNDNVQSESAQGHLGTLAECGACHATPPAPSLAGPHGMHPVGESWAEDHGAFAESNGTDGCRSCHGASYEGTVLSLAQSTRTLTTDFGVTSLWRGFRVGCWACHLGPGSENDNPNHPAVAQNGALATTLLPRRVTLVATDADGDPLVLRIVAQPRHANVGLTGTIAIVYPEAGYTGADAFTFAGWDGEIDSNLATVTLALAAADGLFADGFESGSASRWSQTGP